MNKKDYIRIDSPEIKNAAYAFIFSECNRIEFLNEDGYGKIDCIESFTAPTLKALSPHI